MYWIIPLLLAFLCTLVNPYLGLVGLLYIGEIAVYLFFDGNAEKAADFASGYVEKTDAKYYEILKKAGLNTILGMGTVFVVLIFISFIISLFKFIPALEQKFKKSAKTEIVNEKPTAALKTEMPEVSEDVTEDTELAAVIAAAIAASEGTSADGFIVRSIKRRKSNKWN